MTDLNTKLIALAHDAIFGTAPAPRHYAAPIERDANLRELMAEREEHIEPQDAEEYFLEQQCPSDATFR